ncbi:MAG: hypothetical protein AAF658_14815, partial [Myxococcota bacterium]
MWLPVQDDEDEPKPLSPRERKKLRAKRHRFGAVEMVVPPNPWTLNVPEDYVGDVFIWDLDKTYLR